MVDPSIGARQICSKIFEAYGETFVKEAFNLLNVLFNNIITHPNEDKYKGFKKSNPNLKTKVLLIKETLELIKAIGYIDIDDNVLQFKGDPASLKQVTYILNEYIEKINKTLEMKQIAEEANRQQQIKANMEEINRKRKEKQNEEAKIKQQLDNDRKEKAMEKACDSVNKGVGYGCKEFKFVPNPKGG